MLNNRWLLPIPAAQSPAAVAHHVLTLEKRKNRKERGQGEPRRWERLSPSAPLCPLQVVRGEMKTARKILKADCQRFMSEEA